MHAVQAMDVILVGLPGSGKSAVGRRLAHRHGATFIDLDDTIEKTAESSIPEIFAQRGELAAAREASVGTTLLRATSLQGTVVLGEGIAAVAVGEALRAARARRAILVSEPGAWDAVGGALAATLADDGWPVEQLLLPQG